MVISERFISRILLLIILCNPLLVLSNDNTLPKEEKLLRYQEVFHHYYRKDELNALVNLQAGFVNNTISPKLQSNQLLLGSLLNSYGVSSAGTPLLQNVALNAAQKKVSDLAWFYLSKQYYKDENFGQFEKAIKNTGSSLPAAEFNERQYMYGMYFIKLKDLVKAEAVLNSMDSSAKEYPFLMFNVGAAFLKVNQIDKGIKYISKVGGFSQQDETLLALKDKANIVLGYQYLRSGQSVIAIQYFEQVRLEGAFSEKALLGLGWAYSQTNEYRRALVPWLMLSEQDPTHIEVQEVLMAVPYTYRELDSKTKSVELYRASISKYEDVKQQLDDAIGFVESASLFSMLFVDDKYDDYAISKQLRNNLRTDLGKLLLELLKEKEIQEMLDEYRDLLQLRAELSNWSIKLETMNTSIGLVEDGGDLPELSHDLQAQSLNVSLPDAVARKIQYKDHLLTLSARVKLQQDRLNILLELYEQKIRESVLKDLKLRSQFVVTYLSQTRYSLAELLDKARRVK